MGNWFIFSFNYENVFLNTYVRLLYRISFIGGGWGGGGGTIAMLGSVGAFPT